MTTDNQSDGQWPRFVVFQQAGAGKPYQYVGSVHAPDPEMALLNARDVFVRRPACNALWVVPAAKIFTRTLEELAEHPNWAHALPGSAALAESYHVFLKLSQAGPVVQAGEMNAPTPEHALKKALLTFTDAAPLWWWIVPEAAITRSADDEIDSMFAPALDKIPYRDQGNFHSLTLLKRIKAEREQGTARDDS